MGEGGQQGKLVTEVAGAQAVQVEHAQQTVFGHQRQADERLDASLYNEWIGSAWCPVGWSGAHSAVLVYVINDYRLTRTDDPMGDTLRSKGMIYGRHARQVGALAQSALCIYQHHIGIVRTRHFAGQGYNFGQHLIEFKRGSHSLRSSAQMLNLFFQGTRGFGTGLLHLPQMSGIFHFFENGLIHLTELHYYYSTLFLA